MSPKYEFGADIDLDEEVIYDKTGRRLTEERAEQLAEETLREVRRGRPSLSGEAAHSPKVSFRVAPELQAQAAHQAEEEGRAVSVIARDALVQYLERVTLPEAPIEHVPDTDEPAQHITVTIAPAVVPRTGPTPRITATGPMPQDFQEQIGTVQRFLRHARAVENLELGEVLAATHAMATIEAMLGRADDRETWNALEGLVDSWARFIERLNVNVRVHVDPPQQGDQPTPM